MSYLDWKVGDRVVCIDPTWGAEGDIQRHFCPNLPEQNRVYTLRSVDCRMVVRGKPNEVLVRLVEVVNPHNYQGEPVFFARKFRKVQPRKTSIASLEAILHGARVPEDA